MANNAKPIPMPRIRQPELSLPLRLVALILQPVVRFMFRVEAHGVEKLPKQGAYILTPNHATNVDALGVAYFIYVTLRRAPHFLAKEKLFTIPVIGKLLLAAGQIPVFRTGGQRNDDSMRAAYAYLEAGHSICVFPEGTLTREPNMWPMRGKTGAVRLALESGVPVYPVGHWGSEKILSRYSKKFRPGFWKKMTFLVGDEIDLSKYRKPQLPPAELYEATELVMREITKLVEQLRGEKAPEKLWNPVEAGQSITGNFIKKAKKSEAKD
jgi:1-acyl-sn-glycerol-3-phosphate acyltransferase